MFISASSTELYAFDKTTGELEWQTDLGGGGFGNPMTYRSASGRQFIVIATSRSDGSEAALKAFALAR